MKSLALIVLIVLQVLALTRAEPGSCCAGVNEIFDSCGTNCETDCANPGPLRCDKSCKSGCFCKPGYIRNNKEDGVCIKPEKCSESKCNIDTEEFKCGVKQCEFICGIGVDEFCSRARFMCKDGCFCKQDYVRDVNGKCIPRADCPSLNDEEDEGRPSNY